MRTLRTVWMLLLLVMLAGSLFAAAIEPGLETRLNAATEKEEFSVIVKLWNPHDIQQLDRDLHERRAPLAERHLLVYNALRANAAETQGPVIEWLEGAKRSGTVAGFTAHWIENLIVVVGSADAILGLSSHPAIESIGPNFTVELINPVVRGPVRPAVPRRTLDNETTTPGQDAIGATRVNRELGINGNGVLVADCDTGVDGDHPALDWRWRGNHAPVGECWLDLLGGYPLPADDNGHGSHVMGTICGREIQTDGDTITVGSAPMAEWIATNPINQGVGGGFDQDVIDAYEWFIDPDGNPNTLEDVPDVIQNSWGVFTGLGYPQCYSNWNTVITNCEAAGPVITWSAGNEGNSGLRAPAIHQLTPTQIFSVGAVDATNFNAPYPIADFSSRGPSHCPPDPNAIKPEISAPGVDVYSVQANSNGYTDFYSGTSMAGPHVAGVVALMREACPNCDPTTIKEAIMTTADDYGPAGEDNTFGAGFINAYDAVMAVASLGRIDGYATLPNGSPLEGVRVQPLGSPTAANTNASGYYNVPAQAGTYTVRYTKFGYTTVQIENVQTFEGDTTRVDVEMSTVPTGSAVITVRTQIGAPIQNARVKIQDSPLDTMITNALGQVTATLPATTFGVNLKYTINRTPPVVLQQDTTIVVVAGQTTNFDLTLVNYLIEPAGPDAYGYAAYDRYDRDYPAPGEWIEVSADSGGPGEQFLFANDDSSNYYLAPFPLMYYGRMNDSLTVNCNGWFLPGVDHSTGRAQYRIPFQNPSNPDPAGIVAVFWHNLRTGGGAKQWQYYDREAGRWTFEFVRQRRDSPANQYHTYQVHFLDPAIHPTRTGDCEIVFVYGLMPVLTDVTIGIENPAEDTGIEVLWDGHLDSTALPIEAGAALRFTTGLTTQQGTVNGTLTLYPADAGIVNADVWVGGVSLHPNAQGQFTSALVPAAPVSAIALLDGYEVGRIDSVVVPNNGSVNMALHARHIDPATALSATQETGRVTLSWAAPASVQLRPAPAVSYDIYENGAEVAQGVSGTQYVAIFLQNTTVEYTVQTNYLDGQTTMSSPLIVEVNLSAEALNANLPTAFALYPNYPNPFNPETQIRLDVPTSTRAALEVFDIQGRLVRTLLSGSIGAGVHTFGWNGRDNTGHAVGSGVYLYRFSSGEYTASHKMLLVK